MQMNGKKYLVKGNHDTESNEYYRKVGFIEVYDKPIILDGFWIVSHEPMYVSDMAPYANIYAHVHNNPMYRTVSRRGYCTCVDRNDFRPVSFDDIKEKVRSCN
jgi:calcineurin-like phosphoesterase family protein